MAVLVKIYDFVSTCQVVLRTPFFSLPSFLLSYPFFLFPDLLIPLPSPNPSFPLPSSPLSPSAVKQSPNPARVSGGALDCNIIPNNVSVIF